MRITDLIKANDEVLVQLAGAGDQAALETLLERHVSTAVSFACTLLGNRDDALDAAQTALMKIAREVATPWQGRSFKACLYVRVRDAAFNLRSKDTARQRRDVLVGIKRVGKETEMTDERLERDENLMALREELLALPEQTSALLALHHLDGVPIAQIADRCGLSENACKQRLFRGREELRERLKRRGIVLANASFAVELLDQAFSAGKTMAAKITPAALSGIANRAIADSGSITAILPVISRLLSAKAEIRSSATCASFPTPLNASARARQNCPRLQMQRIVRVSPVAVAIGMLGLAALFPLLFRNRTADEGPWGCPLGSSPVEDSGGMVR